jgi:hypothetical protein
MECFGLRFQDGVNCLLGPSNRAIRQSDRGPVDLGMDLLAMVDGEWHAPVCHSIQRGTSQVRRSQVKFLSKLSP